MHQQIEDTSQALPQQEENIPKNSHKMGKLDVAPAPPVLVQRYQKPSYISPWNHRIEASWLSSNESGRVKRLKGSGATLGNLLSLGRSFMPRVLAERWYTTITRVVAFRSYELDKKLNVEKLTPWVADSFDLSRAFCVRPAFNSANPRFYDMSICPFTYEKDEKGIVKKDFEHIGKAGFLAMDFDTLSDDGEKALLQWLVEGELAFIAHTTKSHQSYKLKKDGSTNPHIFNKWRIYIPLEKAIGAEHYKRLMQALRSQLPPECVLDESCVENPTQWQNLPSVREQDFQKAKMFSQPGNVMKVFLGAVAEAPTATASSPLTQFRSVQFWDLMHDPKAEKKNIPAIFIYELYKKWCRSNGFGVGTKNLLFDFWEQQNRYRTGLDVSWLSWKRTNKGVVYTGSFNKEFIKAVETFTYKEQNREHQGSVGQVLLQKAAGI